MSLRLAVIDKEHCINGTGCPFLCHAVCPVDRAGTECIVTDANGKAEIIEETCIGCLLCVKKCPVNVITVINLAHELTEVPLHQYGTNTFRLYRMVLPRKGEIVGVIGRNGMGKSTALHILAGNIVPNLANYSLEPDYENAIQLFKGKELQAFFTSLKSRGIKISYKPQAVDDLPKVYKKSTVKQLLERVDERKIMPKIVQELGFSNVLDRQLSMLSGGELQKVAIAACFMKDADVYAFDEPSSYLDVAERLKIAKLLRQLTEIGKSVVVIEHDLAVLDYLSDYIHIIYGQQGVYGIISNPKSVLNGINEFLQGYIKDENMRFRPSELKFEVRPPSSAMKRQTLLEYPALQKDYGSFKLSSDAGTIGEQEVIGILGPNAIGKTTFIKMLAGVEKPVNTQLDLHFKVAYKPQYLVPEKDVTVKQLLTQSNIHNDLMKTQINRRLHIDKLYENKVEKLSGGELQKVAVALTLCRESDLILLDEPSAFVDVEDRLNIADAIRAIVDKTGKAAFVVDHDILFMDYVSDRVIVFDGNPAIKGHAKKPLSKHDGMNQFLKNLGITYRRDPQTGRPRANKQGSKLDEEQKKKGEYYYVT